VKRFFPLLVILALAPGPAADPATAVREGNDAFARGEFAAAQRLYSSATIATDDPGLVAFNRAAVHAATGDWRAAEQDYVRCLADAACPPGRKAFAEYNRGVCLLKRGGTTAVYRVAVNCFEAALESEPADPAFAADARHNLELAKLLWQKARLREAKPPPANELPPEEERKPEPPRLPPPQSEPPPGVGENPAGAANAQAKGNNPGGTPTPTDQQTPGAGTLAPLPDTDTPVSRTPADTRAYLAKAAARLDAERRANAELLGGPVRKGVKDW
jgi:tetratricopeptide (TPR) repeat protein